MHELIARIGRLKLIPVVVMEDPAGAEPLASALMEAGLPIMEVTFRTAAAARVLERAALAQPEMLLGAGTVLTVEQAKQATGAGARFVVSPGLQAPVVEWCLNAGVPVLPGVLTPTEIAEAAAMGLEAVKLFPVEAAGGVGYLKAVAAPFPRMRFVPTGGITEENLLSYLELRQVLACGGSWMVRPELLSAGRFDLVGEETRRALRQAGSLPG
ncbi:MAG: bifunctional 4-hydroxy-2-oxoglutarate aldolase/2-dehydro-3-deoxy-phosphogluconate aldolase [Bacteroidota bacterium]